MPRLSTDKGVPSIWRAVMAERKMMLASVRLKGVMSNQDAMPDLPTMGARRAMSRSSYVRFAPRPYSLPRRERGESADVRCNTRHPLFEGFLNRGSASSTRRHVSSVADC
jgi:hypothetical protein